MDSRGGWRMHLRPHCQAPSQGRSSTAWLAPRTDFESVEQPQRALPVGVATTGAMERQERSGMVRALGHACGEWGTSEYEARCDLRALAAHTGTALLVRAPHARRWVGKRARFEGASVPVLSIAGESTIVPLASTGRQSRGASWRTRDMALRPTASLLLVARLTASRGLSSKPPRQRFQARCLLARQ